MTLDERIAAFAELEGMPLDDIYSDMMTFLELCEIDETAEAYFEDLSERLGISAQELREYAQRLREELGN